MQFAHSTQATADANTANASNQKNTAEQSQYKTGSETAAAPVQEASNYAASIAQIEALKAQRIQLELKLKALQEANTLSTLGDGFAQDTLIKTPSGWQHISEIKKGDRVMCLDYNDTLVESTINEVLTVAVPSYLEITVCREKQVVETIKVAHNHRFFVTDLNQWVLANDLKIGSQLLNGDNTELFVHNVTEIRATATFYSLSAHLYQNILVGQNNLIVNTLAISQPKLKLGKGFPGNTLIKTIAGLKPISQIRKGERVLSIDSEGLFTEDVVEQVRFRTLANYLELTLETNESIDVAPDHLFFIPETQDWVCASQLIINDSLLSAKGVALKVTDIKTINKEAKFYSLSIATNPHYFVGAEEILVHNIAVLEIIIATSTIETIKIALGSSIFAGMLIKTFGEDVAHWFRTKILRTPEQELAQATQLEPADNAAAQEDIIWHRAQEGDKSAKGSKTAAAPQSGAAGGPAANPEDPDDDKRKKTGDDDDISDKKLANNKEAREVAKKLGYTETKDYAFNSHGQLVFTNGINYISRDVGGHGPGVWKMYDGVIRIGTFCRFLITQFR